MFYEYGNVTKGHIFQLKKLETSSLLHFDLIEVRPELVLGKASFAYIVPAIEKKVTIFLLCIFSVTTETIYNVACHMTKKWIFLGSIKFYHVLKICQLKVIFLKKNIFLVLDMKNRNTYKI